MAAGPGGRKRAKRLQMASRLARRDEMPGGRVRNRDEALLSAETRETGRGRGTLSIS